MKFIFLVLKGMVVGGANVMPGVSGATLAVILRIYDRMIESINSLFTNMKESLKILIPVGLGMVLGILAVGGAVNFFLERFSLQTGGFIAGLMAGSLPFIHSQAVLKAEKSTRLHLVRGKAVFKNDAHPGLYLISGIAAAVVILLTFFVPESTAETVGVTFSVGFAAHLFIGGVFAAAAMVVPGISGAMVLILFGLYPIAIHAIELIRRYLTSPTDFALLGEILTIAAPTGIGIIVGVLLGSKAIAWLLAKFHSETYFAILGLVLGTVFVIFRDPATYQSHAEITAPLVILTIIAFACGTATSLFLGNGKFEI